MFNQAQQTGYPYRYFPVYPYTTEGAYPEALRLVVESVQSEKEDELFYGYMLSLAPSAEQKEIIASIRDDERKHNLMFREIFLQLTGQDIPPANVEFQKPENYISGIKRALFGELRAVERYRKILFGMAYLPFKNMVTEIYTDELKHATKWNYLYTTAL